MNHLQLLSLAVIAAVLSACGGGNGHSGGNEAVVKEAVEETRPALNLSVATTPLDLLGISVNYAEDVPYGEGDRNLFEILLPDYDGPTPLVIYIHGGGFTGGDKSGGYKVAPIPWTVNLLS